MYPLPPPPLISRCHQKHFLARLHRPQRGLIREQVAVTIGASAVSRQATSLHWELRSHDTRWRPERVRGRGVSASKASAALATSSRLTSLTAVTRRRVASPTSRYDNNTDTPAVMATASTIDSHLSKRAHLMTGPHCSL